MIKTRKTNNNTPSPVGEGWGGVLLLLFLLAGCSSIAEDERLIYVEPATPATPVVTETGETLPLRGILIEDFTGQRCVNCPEAANTIEALIESYGEERIVAVGLHCDPFGFRGTAKAAGLMTDESREYGQHYGVETQPIGMVNRVGGLLSHSQWMTSVYNESREFANVGITAEATYQAATKSVEVTTSIKAFENVGNATLQIWLLQDGIVALQSMPDGSNKPDYEHKHVFRKSVNGLWGESVTLTKTAKDESHTFTHSVSVDNAAKPANSPDYVPENCAVVVVVSNAERVLQAYKTMVK